MDLTEGFVPRGDWDAVPGSCKEGSAGVEILVMGHDCFGVEGGGGRKWE